MDEHTVSEQSYKRGLEAGKPKWIPVTERLPEYRQIVAVRVHFPFDENARTDVTQYNPNYNPQFWERVTHWCELPEPPKGDSGPSGPGCCRQAAAPPDYS